MSNGKKIGLSNPPLYVNKNGGMYARCLTCLSETPVKKTATKKTIKCFACPWRTKWKSDEKCSVCQGEKYLTKTCVSRQLEIWNNDLGDITTITESVFSQRVTLYDAVHFGIGHQVKESSPEIAQLGILGKLRQRYTLDDEGNPGSYKKRIQLNTCFWPKGQCVSCEKTKCIPKKYQGKIPLCNECRE